MENNLAVLSPEIISNLVLQGDLSKLQPKQKVQYYNSLCERIGLDPATQPFKLLRLQGKEVLYADKGATQQLCKIYNISVEIIGRERMEDVFIFTARAKDDKGRFADEIGAVAIGHLKGDQLANALMKASTKAKRRAVLAFCGLGMLDETEIETIPGAQTINGNGKNSDLTPPKEIEEPKEVKQPEVVEPSKEEPKQETKPSVKSDLNKLQAKLKDLRSALGEADFKYIVTKCGGKYVKGKITGIKDINQIITMAESVINANKQVEDLTQ